LILLNSLSKIVSFSIRENFTISPLEFVLKFEVIQRRSHDLRTNFQILSIDPSNYFVSASPFNFHETVSKSFSTLLILLNYWQFLILSDFYFLVGFYFSLKDWSSSCSGWFFWTTEICRVESNFWLDNGKEVLNEQVDENWLNSENLFIPSKSELKRIFHIDSVNKRRNFIETCLMIYLEFFCECHKFKQSLGKIENGSKKEQNLLEDLKNISRIKMSTTKSTH
jgi:hypothetical protein